MAFSPFSLVPSEPDELLRREVEAEHADRARRAEEARHEKNARIVDATEAIDTAEPPTPAELGIDVTGLPPERARLIRFTAWLKGLQKQHDDIENGRAKYL